MFCTFSVKILTSEINLPVRGCSLLKFQFFGYNASPHSYTQPCTSIQAFNQKKYMTCFDLGIQYFCVLQSAALVNICLVTRPNQYHISVSTTSVQCYYKQIESDQSVLRFSAKPKSIRLLLFAKMTETVRKHRKRGKLWGHQKQYKEIKCTQKGQIYCFSFGFCVWYFFQNAEPRDILD